MGYRLDVVGKVDASRVTGLECQLIDLLWGVPIATAADGTDLPVNKEHARTATHRGRLLLNDLRAGCVDGDIPRLRDRDVGQRHGERMEGEGVRQVREGRDGCVLVRLSASFTLQLHTKDKIGACGRSSRDEDVRDDGFPLFGKTMSAQHER